MVTSHNVAVLRGGPSYGYDLSLKTGATIVDSLLTSTDPVYTVYDILIDEKGLWYRNGVQVKPVDALMGVDLAIIAMHGDYGEDGTVQRLLEMLSIPYTGSSASSSALGMNKAITKQSVMNRIDGVQAPESFLVKPEDAGDYDNLVEEIFQRIGPPYVVKPINKGSSVGVLFVRSVAGLPDAIEYIKRTFGVPALVEQYVEGNEVTCGVIEKYRDKDYYALPPVNITRPSGAYVLDTDAKYSDDASKRMCCPSNLSLEDKGRVENAAKEIHDLLDFSDYSRSDFILTPQGVLYYLESNTLPGLADTSTFTTALDAVGFNRVDFVNHLVKLALAKK